METKEAIEQIENYVKALEILKEPESKLYTALKEIVPLLQQGEKYRQIVEKFTEEWSRYFVIQRRRGGGEPIIRNLFKEYKQKYFPKEAKQDEAKDNRE